MASVAGHDVRPIPSPRSTSIAHPNCIACCCRNATPTKLYWPLFWEQADLVQPIITPQQRELVPLLANISGVTCERRKNVQMRFGYLVPLRHNKPRDANSS